MSLNPRLDLEFQNQFDEVVKQQQIDKLNELSRLATGNSELAARQTQNLSLKDLFAQTLQTCIDILQDLTLNTKPMSEIFFAKDRLIYVGIIVIFAAFCLWLLHI